MSKGKNYPLSISNTNALLDDSNKAFVVLTSILNYALFFTPNP
jgi:hypothetical protein